MKIQVFKYCWLFSSVVLTSLFINGCQLKQQKKTLEKTENNVLTEAEKSEGWVLLFDGKTLKGWRGIGRETFPENRWMVEAGTIRNVGSGEVNSLQDGQPEEEGDLMTDEAFNNFELSFEWKIGPAGNTGLKYNVSEEMSMQVDPKYAALGFEYQLLDDDVPEYQGELESSHMCGSLYDMIPVHQKVLKPVGTFNTSRILVNGNHIEHWLNGSKVVAFDLDSELLDSLFQKSKYKDIQGFLNKRKGHIVLQNHKDDAWFRNIKIKEVMKDPIIGKSIPGLYLE